MTKEIIEAKKKPGIPKLILSIGLDTIGSMSYLIPAVGEYTDIVWAPLAGFIAYKMYGDRFGKWAFLFPFSEEGLPFSDILPSFTILWFISYFTKEKKE